MGEHGFKINLLVQINAFGLPEVHRSNIIARVTREMELLFRGDAHVSEVHEGPLANAGGNPVWIQTPPMVEAEVHSLGEEAQVPSMRNEETSTGTGLRSIPGDMLAMRLPIPCPSPNGGTP